MSEFIKLTRHDNYRGGLLWMRRDEVCTFGCMKENGQEFTEVGLRYLGASGCHAVQETPEEIMALLEGKTVDAEPSWDRQTAKMNQFPGLMARLDEATQKNRQTLSDLREISRQNDLLSIALTAKTNQVGDLMARLDEAIRQRDEALLQNDELPAAKTAQAEDLMIRLNNVLQLNRDLQAKTYNLNIELAQALQQRDRLQHKLNSIMITAK